MQFGSLWAYLVSGCGNGHYRKGVEIPWEQGLLANPLCVARHHAITRPKWLCPLV